MRRIQIVPVLVTFVLGGLVTGVFGWTAWGARTAAASTNTGHYQLTVDHDSQWLVDTDTGRVWFRYGTGKAGWEEQSPDFSKPPVVLK